MSSAPLKSTDVMRFLAAKNANKGCASCGGMGVHIFNEEIEDARMLLVAPKFPGTEIDGAKTIEIVMLCCDNCAAVRPHQRQPIIDWMAKNRQL